MDSGRKKFSFFRVDHLHRKLTFTVKDGFLWRWLILNKLDSDSQELIKIGWQSSSRELNKPDPEKA